MSDSHTHADIIEALVLATDRPISASRLASVITSIQADDVPAMVDHLNESYEDSGRAFRIREIAGGYRMFTLADYESYVDALAVTTREGRVSQAGLETLAVVAYRQPVSKGDVEYVRGCDCDGVLRTLLSRKLVAIKGRSDAPGRPLLYVTTERFLEYFGLSKLTDLPDWNEIAALVGETPSKVSLTLNRLPEIAATADAESESSEAEPETAQTEELQLDLEQADVVDESLAESSELEEVALPLGDET